MQKILASILLIAIVGQTFNQGWYFLDYVVQKKEYMKRCVNKSRPRLQCNGKCQMMKKILEQERREQGQAPEMKLAAKLEVLSSRSFYVMMVVSPLSNSSVKSIPSNTGTPVDRSFSFFHPPAA